MAPYASRDVKKYQFLLCFKAGEEVNESRRCKEVECEALVLQKYNLHVASFVVDLELNPLQISASDLLREVLSSMVMWSGHSIWRKYGEIKSYINNKFNVVAKTLLNNDFSLKSGWNIDRSKISRS